MTTLTLLLLESSISINLSRTSTLAFSAGFNTAKNLHIGIDSICATPGVNGFHGS